MRYGCGLTRFLYFSFDLVDCWLVPEMILCHLSLVASSSLVQTIQATLGVVAFLGSDYSYSSGVGGVGASDKQ